MQWFTIINSFICLNLIIVGWYSIKTYMARIKRLEKRVIELTLRYNEIINKVSSNTQKITQPINLSYLEGSLDMVHKDKVATVKAVFHPKKTRVRLK